MWAVRHDGRLWRLEDRTLADLQRLENDAGCAISELRPHQSARHATAIARLLVGDKAGQVRLVDFVCTLDETGWPDDLPDYFDGGVPVSGGRSFDIWICLLCMPPFSFTPRQVREEFTWRDLQLLAASSD